jgi:hypothetical protein
MINNPLWVSFFLCLISLASSIWIMDRIALNTIQFRDPFPDVLPILVELLTLQKGVENAEVWLRIYAG